MMVHNVFFWLRKDLTQAQVKEFKEGIAMLTKLPSVRHGFIGRPSSTNRPIIDRSYDYGLTVVFDDLAAHDAYQIHPDHRVFVDRNESKWSAVKIYDFE